MQYKEIFFGQEATRKLKTGIDLVANITKVTLGAKGKTVLIENGGGEPQPTKDGVTVARNVKSEDHITQMGIKMMIQSAAKTADLAGDGTTTSIVIAQKLINEGFKLLNGYKTPDNRLVKYDAVKLKEQLLADLAKVVSNIDKLKRDVTLKEIEDIAVISANNDVALGKIIAEAYSLVGKEGMVLMKEGYTDETYIEKSDGVEYRSGYVSSSFITDTKKQIAVLNDCLVLLYNGTLKQIKDIRHLLEGILDKNKSMLIIADNFEPQFIAALNANKELGLKVCCVKSPSYGQMRHYLMQDLAAITDGFYYHAENGVPLRMATLNDLGQAKQVIVGANTFTLIEPTKNEQAIDSQIDAILADLANPISTDWTKEVASERLAKLQAKVVTIHVGGRTEMEMKEKRDRVEDALKAVKCAFLDGIVAGGGVTYLLSKTVEDKNEPITALLNKGLYECFATLVRNAGLSPNDIFNRIMQHRNSSVTTKLAHVKENKVNFVGYNLLTKQYGDMFTMGIVDPALVAKKAVENAVSVAITALCLGGVIVVAKGLPNELDMIEHGV